MEPLRERVEREISFVVSRHEFTKPAVAAIMQAVEKERAEMVVAIDNIFSCSGCRICPKHFAKLFAAFKAGGGT